MESKRKNYKLLKDNKKLKKSFKTSEIKESNDFKNIDENQEKKADFNKKPENNKKIQNNKNPIKYFVKTYLLLTGLPLLFLLTLSLQNIGSQYHSEFISKGALVALLYSITVISIVTLIYMIVLVIIGHRVLSNYEINNKMEIDKKEKGLLLVDPLKTAWLTSLISLFASPFIVNLLMSLFIVFFTSNSKIDFMVSYIIFTIVLTVLPGYIVYYKELNKELIKYKDISQDIKENIPKNLDTINNTSTISSNLNNKDSKNIVIKKDVTPILYFSRIYLAVIICVIVISNSLYALLSSLWAAFDAAHNKAEPLQLIIRRQLIYFDSWIIIINLLYMIIGAGIGYIVAKGYERKNKMKFEKNVKVKIILDSLRNSIVLLYFGIFIVGGIHLLVVLAKKPLFGIAFIVLFLIFSYIFNIYQINKKMKKVHEKIKFENKESENKKAKKLK